VLELNVVNAALEAIKHRYGLQGFHLIDQSGGACWTADCSRCAGTFGCAVPGAGRLALIGDPVSPQLFNSADAASVIAPNGARTLVVDDPRDKYTPGRTTRPSSKRCCVPGGQAELFAVTATDDYHHDVVPYAMTALAG
jgi:hypothetical protein